MERKYVTTKRTKQKVDKMSEKILKDFGYNASKPKPKPKAKPKGLEISLPGGGSKNSITGKITPPKPKPMPTGPSISSKQYDAQLRKVIADMKKTKR